MPDLLLELFSEEIPAGMQAKAGGDLKRLVTDALVDAGLTYASAGAFWGPRRLTLAVEGLTSDSPTTVEERKGPRVDAPEKALEGFLRATGLSKDQLELRDDKKGQVYFAKITHPGRGAAEIIAEAIPAILRNFPWPKSMRWGPGSLRWVRPLHRILCILSDESGTGIVQFETDGIASAALTEGHRFMAPGEFSVANFEDYTAKLKRAKVVLSAQEREDTIWHDATNLVFAAGLELVEDRALLAEVAGLVEWPVVLMGEIGAAFLDLPPEVLQSSMAEHQKYFSVRNPGTGRIERFIAVANRETADNGATILKGNQRVLAARLADAVFFWNNDLAVAKAGMSSWQEALKSVTFHAKLGSVADRIDRIAALSRDIAPLIGADAGQAEQAARLAKADLNSEMVFEFPELQGVMGRYYISEAGHAPEIAAVAEEHYKPLGARDDVPTASLSVTVALAEKLDSLAGFWAIDEKPTGSKDPFALRRAALGVIRIVLGNGLRVSLDRLFDAQILRHQVKPAPEDAATLDELLGVAVAHGMRSAPLHARIDGLDDAPDWLPAIRNHDPAVSGDLRGFFHDRLKVHLRDEGIRHDVIDAVIEMPENSDLTLVVARARALQAFMDGADGKNLVQGYKRAANILAQAEAADGVEYRFGADAKFADDPTERALFAALAEARAQVAPALEREDFADAMGAMATLRPAIDAFFEAVQVNTDSQILRRNRLNLLYEITQICDQIADLGKLEG
ncbi:MAG: glycine--tRNA ligase subunit beta [Pseudomonadota bacterium]